MAGTTIRIFLTDSNPNGLRFGEIGLSTVLGFVIPRTSLATFGQRDEKDKTAVYVLVGEDQEFPGRQKIYIGETDNILKRLTEHNQKEELDFWENTLVFLTKDDNLNKAHVKYLESSLITTAFESKRATLFNTQKPELVKLSEPELADMTKLLEQILILCPIFGLYAFETVREPQVQQPAKKVDSHSVEFKIDGDGYHAMCLFVENKFIIKAGSIARKLEVPSLPESSKAQRKEMIKSGVLSENQTGLLFTQDFIFNSASSAAQVITGSSVNGRIALKRGDKNFGEWYQETIDKIDATTEEKIASASTFTSN